MHTPTPWKINKGFSQIEGMGQIVDKDGNLIATVNESNGDFNEENTEFIVTACNAHDDLLETLLKARKSLVDMKELLNDQGITFNLAPTWKMIEQALAKTGIKP